MPERVARHRVRVAAIPPWVPAPRLLGTGDWQSTEAGTWETELSTEQAADLAARLRGLGLAGAPLHCDVWPRLKRPAVRAGRLAEARRHRHTSPTFRHPAARLDEEGRRSLTPEDLALAVGQQIARALAPGGIVLDAGCGAGGNTIGLARAGLRVLAVERDPHRADLAQHNAEVYGVSSQVRVRQGDAAEAIATADVDAVFVDPPWGPWNHSGCGLADLPTLGPWLELATERHLPVWAKVPPSFDPSTLPGATPTAWFGVGEGDRHRIKFVLLHVSGAPSRAAGTAPTAPARRA